MYQLGEGQPTPNMDLQGGHHCNRKYVTATTTTTTDSAKTVVSDCKFLIDFIMATYLGPDVKTDNHISSASQRLILGLPPYKYTDLGPSYVSISLLERLYYYLLRHALPGLVLDINMLHMYLKGKLFLPSSDFVGGSVQFTSFFPLDLHQQIWYPDSFRIIKGVVLIDDPVVSNIKGDDLNRFRSLTGVNTFKFNLSEYLGVELDGLGNKQGESNGNGIGNVPVTVPSRGCPSGQSQQEYKRKYIDDTSTQQITEFPRVIPTGHNANGGSSKKMCRSDGPSLMPLLSIPDIDNCKQDSSLVLTGTARKGQFGPSVGVVDIGISKTAYLFRVSLPGVKKDLSQFSCEIESNGKVHIRGLLTGGRTITKQSRVFEMKMLQLCSPGPFTVSFSLPGPVDPRLFAPNFRSDAIFEGVVIKQES